MAICEAAYVKCGHSVLCFVQDDSSLLFLLLFPLCNADCVHKCESCAIPLCLSALRGWAISGHTHNLILLMTLAPKDHLVPIVRVCCYFQDTWA